MLGTVNCEIVLESCKEDRYIIITSLFNNDIIFYKNPAVSVSNIYAIYCSDGKLFIDSNCSEYRIPCCMFKIIFSREKTKILFIGLV